MTKLDNERNGGLAYDLPLSFPYKYPHRAISTSNFFQYGGTHVDLDHIFLRNLPDGESNYIGTQSGWNVNGAFMNFEKGHEFLRQHLLAAVILISRCPVYNSLCCLPEGLLDA